MWWSCIIEIRTRTRISTVRIGIDVIRARVRTIRIGINAIGTRMSIIRIRIRTIRIGINAIGTRISAIWQITGWQLARWRPGWWWRWLWFFVIGPAWIRLRWWEVWLLWGLLFIVSHKYLFPPFYAVLA